MHIAFLHNAFPGHFGALASKLVKSYEHTCSFIANTNGSPKTVNGVNLIPTGIKLDDYIAQDRFRDEAIYFDDLRKRQLVSLEFLNHLKTLHNENPVDLVVVHTDWADPIFVRRHMPDVKIIAYVENYYQPGNNILDFRNTDMQFPPDVYLLEDLRNQTRLASIVGSDAAWASCDFTKECLPDSVKSLLTVQHEGIDIGFWYPLSDDEIRECQLPHSIVTAKKLVTYAARHLEMAKGYDIFMQAAKRAYETDPDIHFAVVGQDGAQYSAPMKDGVEIVSLKDWVAEQDDYDMSRFTFINSLTSRQLAGLFSLSSCHVYLSAPMVMSWSPLNAMACCTPIIGSETGPVPEVIKHKDNGYIIPFTDYKNIGDAIVHIVKSEDRVKKMGELSRKIIEERYSFGVTTQQINNFFTEVVESE